MKIIQENQFFERLFVKGFYKNKWNIKNIKIQRYIGRNLAGEDMYFGDTAFHLLPSNLMGKWNNCGKIENGDWLIKYEDGSVSFRKPHGG